MFELKEKRRLCWAISSAYYPRVFAFSLIGRDFYGTVDRIVDATSPLRADAPQSAEEIIRRTTGQAAYGTLMDASAAVKLQEEYRRLARHTLMDTLRLFFTRKSTLLAVLAELKARTSERKEAVVSFR